MAFTKHGDVETPEVLSPREHRRIERGLHRLGHKSATDLTKDERATVLRVSDGLSDPKDPQRSAFKGIVPRRVAEGLRPSE